MAALAGAGREGSVAVRRFTVSGCGPGGAAYASTMIKADLYDAEGHDREVSLEESATASAVEHFQSRERCFERTLDAIDHGRELMQCSFDLFNIRVADSTNDLVRRLSFVTVMLGCVGAVARIFGMNFETPHTVSRWRGWI